MRRYLLLLVCATLCSCVTKRKVKTKEGADVHIENKSEETHNAADVNVWTGSASRFNISDDEVVYYERVTYRKDTLLPAEVVRVTKTKKRSEAIEVLDSSCIAISTQKDSITHYERKDSVQIKEITEKKSKSSRPLNFTLMVVALVILLLCLAYYTTKRRD